MNLIDRIESAVSLKTVARDIAKNLIDRIERHYHPVHPQLVEVYGNLIDRIERALQAEYGAPVPVGGI